MEPSPPSLRPDAPLAVLAFLRGYSSPALVRQLVPFSVDHLRALDPTSRIAWGHLPSAGGDLGLAALWPLACDFADARGKGPGAVGRHRHFLFTGDSKELRPKLDLSAVGGSTARLGELLPALLDAFEAHCCPQGAFDLDLSHNPVCFDVLVETLADRSRARDLHSLVLLKVPWNESSAFFFFQLSEKRRTGRALDPYVVVARRASELPRGFPRHAHGTHMAIFLAKDEVHRPEAWHHLVDERHRADVVLLHESYYELPYQTRPAASGSSVPDVSGLRF